MRDWLAKLRRLSAAPTTLRTVADAFLLGGVSQLLNLLRMLPLVASFLTLSAALTLRRVLATLPDVTEPIPAAPSRPGASRRIGGALLALLGAGVSVACSKALFDGFAENLFTVLLAGPPALAALGLGLDLSTGYGFRFPTAATITAERRVVLLVLAVGFLFRFGSTGYFPLPDGFSSIEEMQRASGGYWILRGQRPWEFPLAQYLAAASFSLFGRSIYALRLPVTALAWLTLPVFYLLLRRLVSFPAAIFATALLAVSRWHCQVGWYAEDVYIPLFPFTILLYLLVRTRREARPSLYVAAGALCGYMLYDYAAYRAAPLVVGAFFAADALWQRRWPRDWPAILLLFGVTALFVPPLVGVLDYGRGANFYVEAVDRSLADQRYYASDPWQFAVRRAERIRQAADAFSVTDHLNFFTPLNLEGRPLLDPPTGLFFALGLGTTLLFWRRRYYAYFSLTFLALATGAMVFTWNLDFRRLAILIPFVFVFTAFLAHLVDEECARAGRQRLYRRLLALAAVAAGLYNAAFLVSLARDHEVRASHRTPYTIAGGYLQRNHAKEYVLLLSPYALNFFESNDYDWMKPPVLFGRVARGVDDVLNPEPPIPEGLDVVILIARPYDIRTLMAQVLDVYENTTCEFRADPDDFRHDLGVCRLRRVRPAANPRRPSNAKRARSTIHPRR